MFTSTRAQRHSPTPFQPLHPLPPLHQSVHTPRDCMHPLVISAHAPRHLWGRARSQLMTQATPVKTAPRITQQSACTTNLDLSGLLIMSADLPSRHARFSVLRVIGPFDLSCRLHRMHERGHKCMAGRTVSCEIRAASVIAHALRHCLASRSLAVHTEIANLLAFRPWSSVRSQTLDLG